MHINELPIKYDAKYAEILASMSWQRSTHGYARHAKAVGGKMKWVSMHRLVWQLEHGTVPPVLDHMNGDRMDNRLCNLRPATMSLNAHNLRRGKRKEPLPAGVYRNKTSRLRPYGACISYRNGRRYLGVFETADLAAAAYAAAKAAIVCHEAAVARGESTGDLELEIRRGQRGRPRKPRQ